MLSVYKIGLYNTVLYKLVSYDVHIHNPRVVNYDHRKSIGQVIF